MRVGLFIPCYIDQFYPHVGMATLEVLEYCGVEVDYPEEQTCCGQPMANSGCNDDAQPLARRFYSIFHSYDAVVCPSGSCVAMVKHHYDRYYEETGPLKKLQAKTYELAEFLHDVMEIKDWPGHFPHRVGIHQSCHGLRELHLAESSERMIERPNKVRSMLSLINGIKVVDLQRPDECCGFGGMFSVGEEAVSCMMGQDRLADHRKSGTQVLVSADMSCLMHLGGLNDRSNAPLQVKHIAEVLCESLQSTQVSKS